MQSRGLKNWVGNAKSTVMSAYAAVLGGTGVGAGIVEGVVVGGIGAGTVGGLPGAAVSAIAGGIYAGGVILLGAFSLAAIQENLDFFNLIVNAAIKYSLTGLGKGLIAVSYDVIGGQYILQVLADNGSGQVHYWTLTGIGVKPIMQTLMRAYETYNRAAPSNPIKYESGVFLNYPH